MRRIAHRPFRGGVRVDKETRDMLLSAAEGFAKVSELLVEVADDQQEKDVDEETPAPAGST